jgi:hypothetical protein
MKKTIALLLTAIMVFSIMPMLAAQDAFAVEPSIEVTGHGSYYYDGHEKTIQAKVKDGTGYTLQYSYYSVYEKVTWTEDAPKLVEPGSIVINIRAIKDGAETVYSEPVFLEVIADAPEGTAVKIIANGSVTKAPVYAGPSTTTAKLGEINAGTYCSLLSRDGQWFEVSDGSITGFVFYEYISITARPYDNSSSGDISKVEIKAHGATYLYDGKPHYIQASLINGTGFTLEFSTDGGNTWDTNAPSRTEVGTTTVKIHAIGKLGVKDAPNDVILRIIPNLPEGTSVKIKAHGSKTTAPIHLKPKSSSTKLGTVAAGTVVKYKGQDGDWIKVSYGEIEGYVYYWFVDLENLEIKPIITTEPQDTWAIKDNDAKFTITAEGTGTLVYQWWTNKDGSWAKAADSDGGNTATYVFKAKAEYDEKQVRCVVTDSNGESTSRDATLTVITGAPKIISEPVNAGNMVGKSVAFTVTALGAEAYQWYYRENSSATWKEVDWTDHAKTPAISVKVTEENNGYQFYCVLSNTIGSTDSETVTLSIVKLAPKIVMQPYADKANYDEDDVATLSLIASGDGVQYQWQRKLKGKKWENCSEASARTATYTPTLTYDCDGAQYRCIIRNPLKPKGVNSKAVKVKVKSKPAQIDTQPSDLTITAGMPAQFEVKLKDPLTGKIKVQWYYRLPSDPPTKMRKCSKGTKLVLLLTKTTVKLNGCEYFCKITRNNADPIWSDTKTLTVNP